MTYNDVLTKIINGAIIGAAKSYSNDEMKREGACAGLNACRQKKPEELLELFGEAAVATFKAHQELSPEYWRHACYQQEIAWVLNCVSAMLVNQGGPSLGATWPTARAVRRVASIVGVAAKPITGPDERN